MTEDTLHHRHLLSTAARLGLSLTVLPPSEEHRGMLYQFKRDDLDLLTCYGSREAYLCLSWYAEGQTSVRDEILSQIKRNMK